MLAIFPYLVALLVTSVASGQGVATAAQTQRSGRCVPGAAQHPCVFLAPFDQAAAAEDAVSRAELRYGLVNDVLARSTCRPTSPDRDRSGRKGWNHVRCVIDPSGQTGRGCDVNHGFGTAPGRCTGTLWQLNNQLPVTIDPGPMISDTHARRARFLVVLEKHRTQCYSYARVTQLPPFAPRLARP